MARSTDHDFPPPDPSLGEAPRGRGSGWALLGLGGGGVPPFALNALPRAVIGAERAALEASYGRNANPQGRQPRQLNPQPNVLRRPNSGEECQERVTELLEWSIYPTTRAPDYVVDQLGYGDLLEEKRAWIQSGGNATAIGKLERRERLVRRTRSGTIEDGPSPSERKERAKGTAK